MNTGGRNKKPIPSKSRKNCPVTSLHIIARRKIFANQENLPKLDQIRVK
jgi:hypothetical protein